MEVIITAQYEIYSKMLKNHHKLGQKQKKSALYKPDVSRFKYGNINIK